MTSSSSPFISVCIPAYRRTVYLRRLLDSIASQTFCNFEVIISDDSGNDDSVAIMIAEYQPRFSIRYYKNEKALGTPANWNFAISKATGEWIKLMHDDDWFAVPTALQTFADATKSGNKFIVSAYNNIDDDGRVLRKPNLAAPLKNRLVKTPMLLLSENVLGQPSVVMVHQSVKAIYDERMKWRVDIDYYMQLLQSEKDFALVPQLLINLGIGSTQVTHSCLNVPSVELPEGWLLLEKYGTESLKNIWVYDAWWRIIRNTGTRGKATLYQYGSPWPKPIENMAERQSRIETRLLKRGFVSKFYMALSYLKDRHL